MRFGCHLLHLFHLIDIHHITAPVNERLMVVHIHTNLIPMLRLPIDAALELQLIEPRLFVGKKRLQTQCPLERHCDALHDAHPLAIVPHDGIARLQSELQ